MSTTHPEEIRDKLKKAGFSEGSDLTDEQLARAQEANVEWSARKLGKFIMEGESNNGDGRATKDTSPEGALALKAAALAGKRGNKIGSPITTGQARMVMDQGEELVPALLAASPRTKLVTYAEGGPIKELPDEARKLLRDFGKEHGDRRLWPRKVVALALAIKS